jgi:hypothetical protein
LRAQALEVVDEAIARVFGVLVVHADVNRLFRTHLLAVAAEDATEFVDLVDQRVAVPLVVFAGYQLDAVADRSATAGRAWRVLLVVSMRFRATGRRSSILAALLLGILHRHFGPKM